MISFKLRNLIFKDKSSTKISRNMLLTRVLTPKGFVYLISLIDWYSRFIISSKLSISMESSNCIEILKNGIKNRKIKPEIINTDQGSQFTSNDWIDKLKKYNIQISMENNKI